MEDDFKLAWGKHFDSVDKSKLPGAPARIRQRFNSIANRISKGVFNKAKIDNHLREQYDLMNQRLERDLRDSDSMLIHITYEMHYWTGFATRAEYNVSSMLVPYTYWERKALM